MPESDESRGLMMDARKQGAHPAVPTERAARSIEWYRDGQSRTVQVGQVCVTVRLIGRKGRRVRIEIMAPAGTTFRSVEP